MRLGGIEQTVLIRGDDRRNPVLLFVHGGPGLPEMPVSHRHAELERDFTVVHWDQRGAGKSYDFGDPPKSMRIADFVGDTRELSRRLASRFGQRKIFLVGYSWGSLVGALAVRAEPSLFHAYIGIGQLVSIRDAEHALYMEALVEARRTGVRAAVRDLERVGPPPYENDRDEMRTKRWVKRLQPELPRRMTTSRFAALAFTSPFYGPLDFVKLGLGAQSTSARTEDEIHATDLAELAPRLDVPVWFFLGRHDTVVSATVLERYFRALHAQRGKHLVWFEQSDHVPHLEEPEKYRALLREIRRSALQKRTN